MNVKQVVKPLLIVLMLAVSASAVAKSASTDFKKEIAKLSIAVDGAKKAKQINLSEQKLFKKELSDIKKLYEQYIKDKNLTAQEASVLKIKLKKTDLNLFRKKYD